MVMLSFSRLAPRVQQNWQIIQSGVSRGMGRDAINNLIRLTGQEGIRLQDIGRGIRVAKGQFDTATGFKTVRRDRAPNVSQWLYRDRPNADRLDYASDMKIEWEDAQGNKGTTWLTIDTDEPGWSREQWEEEARKAFEQDKEGNYLPQGRTIIEGGISPGDQPRRHI